ncbi:hypothetical protein [Lentibacillus salinarum]|uniref:Uncharacterized protein n=1 Tax=Lentibacillus salinarum TaxID=446820 RepID=A0ABW3ZV34_9BACI
MLMLVLGLSVIGVWSAVILLIVSNQPPPVTAQPHGIVQTSVTATKEVAFEGDSGMVYAHDNQKVLQAAELSDMVNQSGKVSIDVLLDELNLE